MINRDGGLWRISWREKDGQIEAWVTDHPHVRAVASSWDEIDDAMFDAVSEHLQAGEWASDWDPPIPCADARATTIRSHVLVVPEGTYSMECEPESLWQDGLCSDCCRPQGPRTDQTLRFRIGDIADVLMHQGYGEKRFTLQDAPLLFSNSTVDALTEAERSTAEWRPAKRSGLGTRKFYEAIPKAQIRSVGMINKPEIIGYRCTKCPGRSFSYHEGMGIYTTVFRAADIPGPDQAAWLDGELALPIDRWRALRDSNKMRMVLSNSIHTITDELIDNDVEARLRKGWKS
ncbi:MAG: hypothetical protein RIB60_04230 [Phycisphaerales bacterium]